MNHRVSTLLILVCWICLGGDGLAQTQGSNSKRDQDDPPSELGKTSQLQMKMLDAEPPVDPSKKPSSQASGSSSGTKVQLAGAEAGSTKRVAKDGTHIFEDLNGRRTIEIKWDDQGIEMVIVRRYSSSHTDSLLSRFPELEDYIALFPKNVRDHEIELNLGVKSTYQAADPEELKSKDRKVYGIFKRYSKYFSPEAGRRKKR